MAKSLIDKHLTAFPNMDGFRKMCWDGRKTGDPTYGSVVGGLLQQRMDAVLEESPAMDEFLADYPNEYLDLAVLLLQLASHFEKEPALYRGGSTSNALHYQGCNYAQRQAPASESQVRYGSPKPCARCGVNLPQAQEWYDKRDLLQAAVRDYVSERDARIYPTQYEDAD